jgi:hypothetical protein
MLGCEASFHPFVSSSIWTYVAKSSPLSYILKLQCLSVCPSFTYLLFLFFSLTSFRFHYLSGVIRLAPIPFHYLSGVIRLGPIPCGVFWGVGKGEPGEARGGGPAEGGHGRGRTGWGGGQRWGDARWVHYAPGSH